MTPAIIIGSGPAGLSMAHHLHRKHIPCTIISADEGPGGLARTVQFNGRSYDLGPHSFYSSYDPRSFALLRSCFSEDELHQLRSKRATITSSFTGHVPPGLRDLIRPRFLINAISMQLQRSTKQNAAATSYANAGARILKERGRAFHDNLFDPWCRKQFGVCADKLDAQVVELLASTRRRGEHLVHPRDGAIGELWTRLAEMLAAQGVTFHYRREVTGMAVEQDRVVALSTSTTQLPVTGEVYCSAPLDVMAEWTHTKLPRTMPVFRSTTLLYLTVARIGGNQLYLTDHRVDEPLGRITFCDNWRTPQARTGKSVICVEFWSSPGDALHDAPCDQLIAHVHRYLVQTRIADPDVDPQHLLVGPLRSTPVPPIGYKQRQEELQASMAHLSQLHPIGRHAAHRWDGVDDAILETSRLAHAHA